MSGVSCRAVVCLIDAALEHGIPMAEFLAGLPERRQDLTNPRRHASWDTFATLVDRLEKVLSSEEALRRVGESQFNGESFRAFRRVGGALASPRDLYRLGARWGGPSLFPMIRASQADTADGRLRQTLELTDGHRACPGFFHIVHGAMRAGPRVLGHPDSEVEMTLTARGAEYLIRPYQADRAGTLTRLVRRIRARFDFPVMLAELEQQQSSLEESYRELRVAHDEIQKRTRDLERVDKIGRMLSEHIELDRVVVVLIGILVEDLRLAGVEVWLSRKTERVAPGPDALNSRFFRRGGDVSGNPTAALELEAAGQPIGRLLVWDRTADPDGARQRFLARLLPWISMALDNARSYEALELHAAGLEQRVRERTARLLSANHHLVREIDARRRASAALLQSEQQLRASERLASIGTLAAGIAHEINNPVGSILAAAQLAQVLQAESGREEEVALALEDIEAQAKRCGEIVRSVLQFSRDERTEKWDCALAEIVTRSLRLTSAFAEERGAQIELQLAERDVFARVNPIQLEQALVNLLRNAVESGATQIVMTLSRLDSRALARVEIRDDGPGIPERDRMRIFEPFYTTKRGEGGTGLGLSVVHGIATEHGGALSVGAVGGGGVAVRLELPTVPPPSKLNENMTGPALPA